jgi:enhancer of mRNA-decapping protein 4
MSTDGEPFGTTPIPSSSSSGGGSLEVTLDLWSQSASAEVVQQPQTQQIAVYEAKPDEECINGSLLEVNQHFVVYAVKNGLIRVLHRHSSLKALLRGHQGQVVTDISFFLDGDVLATVGHSAETGVSKMIVWRIYEASPEILSEKLLEVSSESAQMNRLMWHPFNPNQVLVMHNQPNNTNSNTHQLASLVETTRLQTTVHPEEKHPVCHWYSPSVVMEGALQMNVEDGSLADLAWSGRDSRHVLTVHSNGQIILWDLKQAEDAVDPVSGVSIAAPRKLAVVSVSPDAAELSRCLFLPHENALRLEDQTDILTTCFATASNKNTVITLWSSFTTTPGSLPVKLQVIQLANPSPSYVLDVCFGPAPQEASPPSCFLIWADRHEGKLLAVHVASQWSSEQKALCVGGDYVVPFKLHYPIYSWCVVCMPTQDISEEDMAEHQGLIFDMKLFAYQSKAIQCLTLTSYMCLPPEHGYDDNTPGVAYKAMMEDGIKSELGSIEPEYDEDYDVDDEDAEDDDDDGEPLEAPAAAALPVPPAASGGISNPFANWLGAFAGSSDPAPSPPAPPGMGGPASSEASSNSSTPQPLLNPSDLLKNMTEEPPSKSSAANNSTSKARSTTPNKQNKAKPNKAKINNKSKKDAASPFPDGAKIQILKRDETVPAPPADPAIVDPAIVAFTPPPPPMPSAFAQAVAPDPKLEETLTRVVSQELAKQPGVGEAVEAALASKLVPAVNKIVQESLASFGRPLQSSMDRLGEQGVRVDPKDLQAALDVETPLKAALADTVRNVFIPAMESLTAQIIQKVTPPPPQIPAPDKQMMAALENLTQQLSAMNSKMEAMSNEIRTLKAAGTNGGNPPMPPPPAQLPAQPNPMEAVRNEVNALLQQKQYQAAFTKAVSTSNADMAVYACSRANMNAVLGGSSPQLSQPILLCLMQQLGAALATTTAPDALNIELEWLQEIALTLNTADPNIHRHVPSVLQQLVGIVNQKMSQGNPALRRPLHMLLQVIRGMQVGG